MSCKIKREKHSIEGGNRSYFQTIFDFSSLEARLAAIDTVLNDQGLDPVLYNIYKDGADGDLHSVTGFNTFAKSRKCYKIHDDKTGKDYRLDKQQYVLVNRNGKEVAVQVENLDVNDSILEVLEKEPK